MAEFKPSWSDSFKFDGGSFSGGGSGSGFGSSWNPGPGGFSGIGSDSDTWNKGFNLKGNDPFGLNKDKKESPWGDVLRFAGNKLSDYAQSKGGQGIGFAGGGGGVSQNGELTIVYPQAPTVIPGQKSGLGSTIGSIAGAALGSFIPGVGTSLGAGLGGSIGGAFG
jgi:hypothetical protein